MTNETLRNGAMMRSQTSTGNGADRIKDVLGMLRRMMATQYQGLFTSGIAGKEDAAAWELLWTASLKGKSPKRVEEALLACFRRCDRPFPVAVFERAYEELPPDPVKAKVAGALPKPRVPISQEDLKRVMARAKRAVTGDGVRRTAANIASGEWTDEMERQFLETWETLSKATHQGCTTKELPRCCYPGCNRPGAMSSSRTGDGPLWCAIHFDPNLSR